MNNDELVPMIKDLFKGRNDIVARYWKTVNKMIKEMVTARIPMHGIQK